MVVTVEVELCSSVFFPGDPLYCRIIVTNSLNPKNPDSLENTDVSSSENSTPINTPTKSSYIQKDTPPRASVTIDQSNSNKSHTSHSGEDNDLKTELLSWISLQIHGNMLVDPLYVKVSNLPQPASSKAHTPRTALAVGSISSANMASTSLPNLSDLGDNGRSIFATPPTILACELKLLPDQCKTYMVHALLPPALPPSFKGSCIKYIQYFVTIAAQRPREKAHILTIPFRVLNPASVLKKIEYTVGTPGFNYEIKILELDHPDKDKWHRFQQRHRGQMGQLMGVSGATMPYPVTALQRDTNEWRNAVNALFEKHSRPITMQISKGPKKLVAVSISKIAYQPGEQVMLSFDFSVATVVCYQMSVRLESEEAIVEELQTPRCKPVRKVYCEQHDCTQYTVRTHVLFYIPLEASQEFSTDQVTVRWYLNFEFVTPTTTPTNSSNTNNSSNNNNNNSSNEENSSITPHPTTLPPQTNTPAPVVETVQWSLPLRVFVHKYPLEPLQAQRNVLHL